MFNALFKIVGLLTKRASAPEPTVDPSPKQGPKMDIANVGPSYDFAWRVLAPGFLEAIEKMGEKYAHPDEGAAFLFRLDSDKGAIETNVPKMKGVMDISMPPLFPEIDAENGISYVLCANKLLSEMERSYFIKANYTEEGSKIFPCTQDEIRRAAIVFEGRILTCADFSYMEPRWEDDSVGSTKIPSGLAGGPV